MAEMTTLPTGAKRDVEAQPGLATRTPTAPTSGLPAAAATATETQTQENTTKNAMAQRRGPGGLDFTPIITHYLFLGTFVLAIAGWLVAFIGQAALEANIKKPTTPEAGTLWFGIFLHLAVILGVLYTLATDNIALNRLQISVFSGISIIYSVQGVNQGVYDTRSSGKAMGAGYLLLSFVFIIWTLYFTAEEGSITLDLFNSFGTGGLTGPGRRRTVIGGQGVTRSATNINNGYAGNYGSPNVQPANMGYGIGSGIGGGPGGGLGGGMGGGIGVGGGSQAALKDDAVKSQHSLSNKGQDAQSMTSMGARSAAGIAGQGPQTGGIPEASAPLMTGSSGSEAPGDAYVYRAKALYNYSASADDPNELTFTKGEFLDVLDNSGKWWQARKADGTTGIAPSNYLQIV